MKKIILVIVVVFLGGNFDASAQRKKKKEKVEETIVETVEEVEVEEEVIEYIQPSNDYFSNKEYMVINGEKYKVRRLNDTYATYYKNEGYNNKYGIIKKDKVILPNVFSYVSYNDYFYNNKLILGINGKSYGVFDLVSKKWIVPLENKQIKRLAGEYYAIKKKDYFIIKDLTTNEVVANEKWKSISKIFAIPNYFVVKKQSYSQCGVYNIISKKMIIPCDYKSLEYITSISAFLVKKDGLYNVLTASNELLFNTWYQSILVKNNLFIVKKNGKMGVVDRNEKEIIPITYLKIGKEFSDGSYLAQNASGKYGCITITGKVTLPFEYAKIVDNGYGNFKKIESNDKCGILAVNDNKPHVITTCQYDDIDIKYLYFIVIKNGKYGLLDKKGKTILEPKYKKITSKPGNRTIFIVTTDNNNVFMYSKNGTSKKYKDIKELAMISRYQSISEKYTIVQNKKNRYALIDKLEVLVTPFIFDDILFGMSENIIAVKDNGKVGLYDILKQKYVVTSEYDQIVFSKGDTFLGFKGVKVFKIRVSSEIKITPL